MDRAFSPQIIGGSETWAVGPGCYRSGLWPAEPKRQRYDKTGSHLSGHRHGLACHLSVLTGACFQRQQRGTIPAWGTAPGTHSQIHKGLKVRAIPFLSLSPIRIKRLETEPVKGICSPDFLRLIYHFPGKNQAHGPNCISWDKCVEEGEYAIPKPKGAD